MKPFFLIIIIFELLSCAKDEVKSSKLIGVVNITSVTMPDTAELLQPFVIKARAQADNGCWSNLFFNLERMTDPNSYSLTAFGIFEQVSLCPDMIVTADSSISLKLNRKGIYYIYVVRSIDLIDVDSVLVK